MDPSLSPNISVGLSWGNLSSPYRFLSQQASRPASDKATYSDSVIDNAIIDCFFDFQVIAPLEARNTYSEVDLPSF
jgi:hypothetical protein